MTDPGHAEHSPHFAVVVSDGAYNWLSTIVVVPFSAGARRFEFRLETAINGVRTRALMDQVTSIDKAFLREYVGSLVGEVVLEEIGSYLRDMLDLPDDSLW
ncbi:MAG: type II toxin-antitoxin system PemK/MazF family toxin [Dehalococcoidia bacterium]|nr:type II toxin-antitoxin system PemK/MazF family toxin [Dehalococcoidia bacterium]